MSNLLLNFPEGYTPNKNQVEILKKVDVALEKGHKFIVIHANTGCGKSHCAKTIGNSVDGPSDNFKKCVDDYSVFGDDGAEIVASEPSFGAYVLTITKSLQDQYQNIFDDTGILKGQSNYACAIDDTLSVDIAPCMYIQGLKARCWSENKCPYYNDRNRMLKSQFSALNYSMFFSLPEHLKRRKVIICDEASELEEQLVNQFTCVVDLIFLQRLDISIPVFPTVETPSKLIMWLSKLLGNVNIEIESYLAYFKAEPKKGTEFHKKKSECLKLSNQQKSIQTLIETFDKSDYIVEHVDGVIRFIPLKVDQLAQQIFDHADHVVFMSATIIDKDNFCKRLGIKSYAFIEADSEFDPENAPIHVMVKQRLNYANLKSMLPTLAKQVTELISTHKDEKGIVHTHTQTIANFMRDNVKSGRLLVREAGVKNEELLDLHINTTKPTVLVSPSMTYGVDLADDLGRFQIILKAPWLPTKDPRVEKMMKIDKEWYVDKMLCTLVQACGRGIRNVNDHCVTYILDGSIYDTIKSNKHKLPKFFLDRFQ